MGGYNANGNLPVRNWSDGYFKGLEKITSEAVRDTVRVGMEACPGCQVRCKKVVEFDEPYKVNRRNGGPEYETLRWLHADRRSQGGLPRQRSSAPLLRTPSHGRHPFAMGASSTDLTIRTREDRPRFGNVGPCSRPSSKSWQKG
jgi:hypothetical protein